MEVAPACTGMFGAFTNGQVLVISLLNQFQRRGCITTRLDAACPSRASSQALPETW